MSIRHVFVFVFTVLIYFGVTATTVASENNTLIGNHAQEEKETPSHAKWGKRAMVEVKKKYPHSEIYDYRHVGREEKGQMSIETFQLWIRENHQTSKVTVRITFDSNSQNVTNITVHPSSS